MPLGGSQGVDVDSNPTKIEEYVSPELAITSAGAIDFNHGLSKKPQLVQTYLRCKTAELGWAVGDMVDFSYGDHSSTASPQNWGLTYAATDTTITGVIGGYSTGIQVMNKSTGVLGTGVTPDNWRIVIVAYALTIGDVPDIKTVGLVPLEKKLVVAGDADLEFNLAQYFNEYEDFEIDIKGFQCTTDDQDLAWQSAPDGVTYDATASDYVRQQDWGTGASSASASDNTATSAILTTFSTGTASAREHHTHHLKLSSFEDPNEHSRIFSVTNGFSAFPAQFIAICGTANANVQQDKAIRFIATSGNLGQGIFILYGKRKVV